jgi:hypothetical protein
MVEKACEEQIKTIQNESKPILQALESTQAQTLFQISGVDAERKIKLDEIQNKYHKMTQEIVENHEKKKSELLKRIESTKQSLTLLEQQYSQEIIDCQTSLENMLERVPIISIQSRTNEHSSEHAVKKSTTLQLSAVDTAKDDIAKLNTEVQHRFSMIIDLLNGDRKSVPEKRSKNPLPPIMNSSLL